MGIFDRSQLHGWAIRGHSFVCFFPFYRRVLAASCASSHRLPHTPKYHTHTTSHTQHHTRNITLPTSHPMSHTQHRTPNITHSTLHTQNHTPNNTDSTSHTQHHTPNIEHPTSHAQHHTPKITHPTPHTQHHTLNITHSTSHTQHHTPNITHPTPHTQHHTLNTTHPTSHTQRFSLTSQPQHHTLNITHPTSLTSQPQHHTLDITHPTSHIQHHKHDTHGSILGLFCLCVSWYRLEKTIHVGFSGPLFFFQALRCVYWMFFCFADVPGKARWIEWSPAFGSPFLVQKLGTRTSLQKVSFYRLICGICGPDRMLLSFLSLEMSANGSEMFWCRVQRSRKDRTSFTSRRSRPRLPEHKKIVLEVYESDRRIKNDPL